MYLGFKGDWKFFKALMHQRDPNGTPEFPPVSELCGELHVPGARAQFLCLRTRYWQAKLICPRCRATARADDGGPFECPEGPLATC